MNNRYWEQQRVLITGGSSGLGKALALTLDEYGAQVAIVARDRTRLEQTVQGTSIHPIQGDIGNKDHIHRVSGEALGVLGGVDFLFNNASYLGETPLRLLMDTECEDLETALNTNLLGTFRLTKTILPNMLLQNRGTVVNLSSDAAVSAYPNWGGYSMSKAAVDHLTRIWSEELAAEGIRFLAVDPGDMNTPMHFAAIPDANAADLLDPAVVAQQLLGFLSTEQTPNSVRYSRSQWSQEVG